MREGGGDWQIGEGEGFVPSIPDPSWSANRVCSVAILAQAFSGSSVAALGIEWFRDLSLPFA